jgi:cholesterol oxidase
MQFLLTIIAYNAESLVEMDDNSALITGAVSCRALSPDPLIVTCGKFRLFIPATDNVDSNQLMYDLNLSATDGTKYRFKGYKLIRNGTVVSGWEQTTTLYVTIYLLDDYLEEEETKIIGRGILQIKPFDFLKQLTTLRVRK